MTAFIRGPLARALTRLAAEHGRHAFAVWAVLLLGFAAALTRVAVETDATRWFPPGNAIRDSYEAIRARLSGISPVNIVIEARDGAAADGGRVRDFAEPDVLAAVDDLARFLERLPEVGRVVSYVRAGSAGAGPAEALEHALQVSLPALSFSTVGGCAWSRT